MRGHIHSAPFVEPGLYLAATPIGNLGDITIRVLEHLAGCDVIACEDTRVTAKLLRHYGIRKKTVSYNEHNAGMSGSRLIEDIIDGKSVVLVSDAGTPVISDPGFRLVAEARKNEIPVIPLPGASAPLAALIASGIDSDTWTFAGFLPSRQGSRLTRLEEAARLNSTLIFFESPNRLVKSLADMVTVFGPERHACVARELTKVHEEFNTASLQNLLSEFQNRTVKGEVVIVVAPPQQDNPVDADVLLTDLLETMSVSKAAAEAAQLTGLSKRDMYQRALLLRGNS
ncbi:MAG: 16S rRNA (cytidine(1402)-2'-O)-methyltransferase [Pseudomonadota bacterium]